MRHKRVQCEQILREEAPGEGQGGGTVNKTRGVLYLLAKLLGDFQAVRQGRDHLSQTAHYLAAAIDIRARNRLDSAPLVGPDGILDAPHVPAPASLRDGSIVSGRSTNYRRSVKRPGKSRTGSLAYATSLSVDAGILPCSGDADPDARPQRVFVQ